MKLRVGLVGLGDAWQTRHRPALRALADRFEVRAVCDEVGHRAQQVASDFGAQTADGVWALAGREDLDAILMLAAQWYGSLPILAACHARKAIYCGAALNISVAQAQMLKRCVEEAGIAFVAEFLRRHAPSTVRLKELIATRLGPPRLLFCHQRHGTRVAANHVSPDAPPPPAMEELVGMVDWCRYVVGSEPTSVSGLIHRRHEEPCEEDYQMLSLDFSPRGRPGTGPVAQISCGQYLPAQWEEAIGYRTSAGLQVACQNGVAFIDLPSTLVWFDDSGRHQEALDSERPVGEQLLTQFHRAVTSLVRKTCDLEDAYRALAIVQRARQSHEEGLRVELED